jgi:hypothetical protein
MQHSPGVQAHAAPMKSTQPYGDNKQMKNTHTTTMTELAKLPAARSAVRATMRSPISRRVSILGLTALLAAAGPAWAQTTNIANVTNTLAALPATVSNVTLESITGDKGRLTIPVNSSNSVATEIRVHNIAGATVAFSSSTTNFVDPNYEITNYYDFSPKYVTLTPVGFPSANGTTVVLGTGITGITNNGTGNLSQNVAVTLRHTNVASGDYNAAVEVAGVSTWSYPIPVKAGYQWNAGGGANTNFSNTANWIGGVVPGANDIVILDTAGAVASATQPTIAIAADTTIGSVSDIHTGNNYTHWSIAAGTSLSILGDDGFRQLVDWIDDNERSKIRASGAGTMVISNVNAEFNMFMTAQNSSQDSADFSALNTLILDVKKIAFNDIGAYPKYGTNGVTTKPSNNVYDMDWALTNILRATLTDANGWTNNQRDYGMVINRHRSQTGSDGGMHFGLHNELYMDSILFGGYSQMENPEVDFRAASGSYLLLRNTDKVSRVSNLTVADGMDFWNPSLGNSGGTKIDVSFTKGTVDVKVDTLILGRDPDVATDNASATGKLLLGAGTFDVNNAIFGYQTGLGIDAKSGGGGISAAQGRLELSLGGIFRVNNTLVLGYMTTNNLTTASTWGQLAISGAGSTAQINKITVGGPTNDVFQANNISVTSGGTLIISNSAGSASVPVNQLTMNDSTLTIFPHASTNAPCLFVRTLVTGGAGNTLNVASLTGVGAYPVTVPLISYVNTPAPNLALVLPPGLYGYLVNNAASNTIDAVISTTPPQNLVWDGGSGVWDQSAPNWLGGAVFADGDAVKFDDNASGTTSVNVSGTVILGSGGILVTNNDLAYTIGGGNVAGSATLTKEGTNTLTFDANSALAVVINRGTVNGSGTLGVTTVGTNGALSYSGTINKLTTSGVAENSGTVNLALSVAGGVFKNTGTVNGTFSTSGGSVVTNSGSITIPSNGTLGSGTTLIHGGQFNVNGGVLSVAGHLTGSGKVSDFTAVSGNRTITMGSGLFTPGGSNAIGAFVVEGTVDHNGGGTIVFDFDLNNPATNDVLAVDKFDQFRATFFFNNIGSITFAAGQSFLVISNNYGLPNVPHSSDNYLALVQPKVPGVGLQWNFANFKTNGIVAVMAAPLTPPHLTNAFVGGTNITFSWPSTHLGYQLQVQTNSLNVGLTSTNWHPVNGTEFVTSTNLPVDSVNPSVFFRLSNQ